MEYTSLQKIFTGRITYIIPPYQRPYSWDCIGKSEKNNQINVFWQDLYTFFEEKENKALYFMGSMVLIDKDDSSEYEVIDGQQRLTSITLLLASMRCFLRTIKKQNQYSAELVNDEVDFIRELIRSVEDIIFERELKGIIEIKKKVRIEKISGDFEYDKVLKEVLECLEKPKNLKQHYHYTTEEQLVVINRYYRNREYFIEKFKDNFLTDTLFTSNDFRNLNDFFFFLKERLAFIEIKAKSFDFAYRIFETLNNRGLPLSSKDLFRNFIIEKFATLRDSGRNDIDPIAKWNELDVKNELKEDFLGRWVESKNAAQQKLSVFNDFQTLFLNYHKEDDGITKIEKVHADIKKDLPYYHLIESPENIKNLNIRNKLFFLQQCGNVRYTTNLLLALFRRLDYQGDDNVNVLSFMQLYEQSLLYILLHPSKRFSNGPIYKTINCLNQKDLNAAKTEIAKRTNKEELKTFINEEVRDNQTAKLLISKYIWSQQSADDLVSQTLHYGKATLEHIIPQQPDPSSLWVEKFDDSFRKENTYLLGNMTLLTKANNSGANNKDLDKKAFYYDQTQLSLTRELIQQEVNEALFKERQEKIVRSILLDLGL